MLCASKGYSDPSPVPTGHHPLKVGKHCRTSCPCKQGWVSLLSWGVRDQETSNLFLYSTPVVLPSSWPPPAGDADPMECCIWRKSPRLTLHQHGRVLELNTPSPSSPWRAKMQQGSSTEPPSSLPPIAIRVIPQVKKS